MSEGQTWSSEDTRLLVAKSFLAPLAAPFAYRRYAALTAAAFSEAERIVFAAEGSFLAHDFPFYCGIRVESPTLFRCRLAKRGGEVSELEMLALFQADKRTVFAGSRPTGGLMLFQSLIFGVARRFVEQSSYRSESPLPGVSSTDDLAAFLLGASWDRQRALQRCSAHLSAGWWVSAIRTLNFHCADQAEMKISLATSDAVIHSLGVRL